MNPQLVGLQKIRAKMISLSRLGAQSSDAQNAKKGLNREETRGNLRHTTLLTADVKGAVGQRI